MAYVTGNTYIGSTTVGNLAAVCSLESARFAGPLNPGDKLGEYLRNDDIGPWAELPDGRIVLTIQFHADVSEQDARAVIEEYGGEVITYLGSVPAATAAIDPQFVDDIAGEDSVQFLDVVSPPLGETNDGARPAANVTPLAGAPYNLTGTGVTVLVYDVGRIDDGHLDFGARIVENDGSAVAGLGFLPLNMPEARVFMGDVGSILLGAAFGSFVFLQTDTLLDFICMASFLSPFYADELTTMAVRIKDGESLTRPHRRHLYQILANEYGIAHWNISVCYSLLQLAIGLSDLLIRHLGLLPVIATLIAYFLIFSGVSFFLRKRVPVSLRE